MDVTLVEGDLLDQPTEAIVNAWNRNVIPWWLLLPQGVSGAIKKRAGVAPFRELGRMGPLPLGDAVHTGAGRLPYKRIIHVASIDLLWRASEFSVKASTRNAVVLAHERAGALQALNVSSGASCVARPRRRRLRSFRQGCAARFCRCRASALVRAAPWPASGRAW